MDGATVYLLVCADGHVYCGITQRPLEERLSEHENGTFAGFTSRRRPVRLLWSEHFVMLTDAIACERRLKGWSRAKKLAMARGDWAEVQALAKGRSG